MRRAPATATIDSTATKRTTLTAARIESRRCSIPDSLFPIPDLSADVDGLEPLLAPVDHEHAEALLHAGLDVRRGRGIAARHVELLARREHLLDRRFPALRVEYALTVRVGRGEDPAKCAGPGKQDADSLHRRDLPNAGESRLALDDREVDELTLRVERPHVGFLLVLLLAHAPVRRRVSDV